MKYTIIAEEDGRKAEQYIETLYPVDTINITAVNELIEPDVNKEYWDAFKEVLFSAEIKAGGNSPA